MSTLLHISDLHRTQGPRLDNHDLLSAIVSDAKRWEEEGISKPDLIVVSGDLVKGTSADNDDPDAEIKAQYQEAADFLGRLAEEFLESDRSRVIVVPGNHDVNWSRSFNAMKPHSTCPPEVASEAYRASSRIRWNWKELRAYEIVDNELYLSRFEHFQKFRADFYAGLDPHPLSHGEKGDLAFFDFPSFGLVVVGFASWHGNDCFCHVGEINSESLALSRELIEKSRSPLAIAVWHHNVEGGPRSQDYMDQHVLHRMMDIGFSIGLHGHQHYPGAIPFELRALGETSMAVIGAGSLSVGNSELPMGERRQFNIIVIDPDAKTITVHVRGMSSAGVFTASHRDDFGGNSFIELQLPFSPKRGRESSNTRLLDEAATAVAVGQYEEALRLISLVGDNHSDTKRKLQIEALKGTGQIEELMTILKPAQSANEVLLVVSCLLNLRRFDEAEAMLSSASELLDESIYQESLNTITVRRMI